ncbi:ABC transporter substrate-binding protein [Aeromicrobium sp. CTD01-1L150]|uniref:ABC transporter substrate-binding protein n=1 Tax=Aeromicrobium sp. CTD01-1L150 TaxID=3341830 RepID=UPI0035BFFB4B
MSTAKRHGVTALVGMALTTIALTGCSSAEGEGSHEGAGSGEFPVTVTDLAGHEVTIESADSVAVTHNQSFGVLESWGVQPTVAARSLMSDNNPWSTDESILDTGTHHEPDFEQVVAGAPDLIISGGRYQDHADDLQKAAPDAAFVDMTNDDLSADEYVVETVTLLGEIFGHQDEAQALIDDFHAAADEAREAYDSETTVMGLVTTANEIRYASPDEGRGASVFFELLNLTPALDAEGSSNHQGDDISIEAIAQANADFLLVLDRDAAVAGDEEEPTPAMELITESPSLANVPAVQNEAIYVMPGDYYLTEDLVAFTDVLEGLAEAFTSAQQ